MYVQIGKEKQKKKEKAKLMKRALAHQKQTLDSIDINQLDSEANWLSPFPYTTFRRIAKWSEVHTDERIVVFFLFLQFHDIWWII